MDNALTSAGAHTSGKKTRSHRLHWRRLTVPLLIACAAFVLTGCYYDEPYYGRGGGYTGVYATYGSPGPYYGGGYGGYGYDPYYYGYGPRYVGPRYVGVRSRPRRGYYANRGRYWNRGGYVRSRNFRGDGREFRRGRQIRNDAGATTGGSRRSGRSAPIDATIQPE